MRLQLGALLFGSTHLSICHAHVMVNRAVAQPSNYLFIFGDSYTTTGFNATIQPQPSLANPLGNPPYPGATFNGRNSANTSNNENWVDFLVYNSSLTGTVGYNYAVGANTVNYTAVQNPNKFPDSVPIHDFVDQEQEFDKIDRSVPWTGKNSVFLTWFGINDVTVQVFGGGRSDDVARPILQTDVNSYFNILSLLYNKGARKFVTILCPPIYRAAMNGYGSGGSAPQIKNLTAFWNSIVQSGHSTWTKQHPAANAVIVDPSNIFNRVLDNPTLYGAPNSSCISYPYGQPCLWTDFIHTGVVLQQEFAKVVAPTVKQLQGA